MAEFWDKETKIGEVIVSDKQKRIVSICEKNEKQYVAVSKMAFVKGEWTFAKGGTSFPVDTFNEICTIVNEHLEGK